MLPEKENFLLKLHNNLAASCTVSSATVLALQVCFREQNPESDCGVFAILDVRSAIML